MRHLFLLIGLMAATGLFGQDQKTIDAIKSEGLRLYRSEMASWYGTDIFVDRFKHRMNNAAGYFSYSDGVLTHCIFFSGDEQPKVLADIAFDPSFSVSTARVDSSLRAFSDTESRIHLVRTKALDIIGSDTFFLRYKNTNYNLVPLVDELGARVYVLTGTQQGGVVFFGNDYLLRFDGEMNLTERKRLHQNIISMPYAKKGEEGMIMHTHLPETGDYLTPTDVCTLMLYEKIAGWKQHYLMTKNFVTIWNCADDEIHTLKREAWERIMDDQKKRRKGD